MASSSTSWKLAATLTGVLAGRAAQKGAALAWRKTRKSEPPSDPLDPFTSWGEAILWSAFTGIFLGVGRMVAQRGVAVGYKHLHGHYPKGIGPDDV